MSARYLSVFVPLLLGMTFIPGWGMHAALSCSALATSYLIFRFGWFQGAWRWAGFASLLWALEELAWGYGRLVAEVPTVLTDSLYFTGSSLWGIALLSMPRKRLPSMNLLFGLPIFALLIWLNLQSYHSSALLFPLSDALLLLLAVPSVEAALQSKAHEGKILWGFGFYVKALASALYGWLSPDLTNQHPFLLLVIFAYLFIGVGCWLELKGTRGTLVPAIFTIVGLEAVVGTVLYMLYKVSSATPIVFAGIAGVLGYLLFFGIAILLITDRKIRLRAEARLKNYSQLLERLLSLRTDQLAIRGLLEALLFHLKPVFASLEGIVLRSDTLYSLGQTKGYAFPIVADGNELGHLYFSETPKNSELLDALSPLLANKIQTTLGHISNQAQAFTDPLTGLLNRRGMQNASMVLVERARQNGQHLSLAIIDLDFFKRVNDQFGHDVGDKALIFLAGILKRNVRQNDLAVRWGGEEFLLILYGANLRIAKDVVKRISYELKSSHIPPISWTLTLSAGVAGGDKIAEDFNLTDCLHEADKMLLEAKAKGRDRIASFEPARLTQHKKQV
ncbi:MAG: GGDEF domain-containing protein [Trueperaceae bacterium]|nr:GGDEF domain-containing protein [Trueperaceae bacterium]